MDDFVDLLKYIIPLAVLILSAIFKKSEKQQKPDQRQRQTYSSVNDMLNDNRAYREEPEYEYYNTDEDEEQPGFSEELIPEEGVRSIFAEEHETAPAESEKPEFDAREAVIYSTILERKY